MDKLFEMINQEFKALGRKYQVFPNFGICCEELRELKVVSFCRCVHSFCSVVYCINVFTIRTNSTFLQYHISNTISK